MMLTILKRSLACIVILAVAVSLASLSSCSSSSSTNRAIDTVRTMSGLQYIDYVVGDGPVVEEGATVKVDYAGYLLDGTLFDTSIEEVGKAHDPSGRKLPEASGSATARRYFDRGGYPFEPFEVANVGRANVIRGWNEGLKGMRVGGHRRLIIPPDLGYGPGGQGAIPPNSTLVFDVYARDITSGPVQGGTRR